MGVHKTNTRLTYFVVLRLAEIVNSMRTEFIEEPLVVLTNKKIQFNITDNNK